MNGIKVILLFVVLLGLVAGCSDEVTRPQIQPAPDVFTVYATVDQVVVHVGDFVTPHARGHDGVPPYDFKWYAGSEWIGVGEEPAPQKMNREGFHTFLVVGTDSLGTVDRDSVVVTVLPAEVQPLSIDLDATPPILGVNNYVYLHTHVIGGTQPYKKYTFYLDDIQMGDNSIGSFSRLMDQQGNFEFRVTVIDSLGVTASDSMMVLVVAPNTVQWCASTNLVVTSSNRTMSELVTIGHSGDFHLWGRFRFDTSPRKDVMIWFTYANGSVRYHTIPDMVPERPAVVLVDLGFWTVEEVQSVTLHLTTDPSKCDGTVSLLELCGSATMPSKAGLPVMILGEGGSYTLIE